MDPRKTDAERVAGILSRGWRRRGVGGMVGGRNWTRTDATPAAAEAEANGRTEDVPPGRKEGGALC